jgi:hypothetical protein
LTSPQRLSAASHALEAHTSEAAAGEQAALSTGATCGASVGIGSPFARRGLQVVDEMLHQPVLQSPSARHADDARHWPVVLHAPERHTEAALAVVHAEVPMLSKPHLLSRGSQTPLTQVSAPVAAVHEPASTGAVCAVSEGMPMPLAILGEHCSAEMLHHCVLVLQSPSAAQPLTAGTQSPEMLPHAPERHTSPAFAEVQLP